ncbi:ATP-binding protein [Blastococcus tunisiensis]|uniref:Regulatory protein, luxR family n=1 Tax=Blastococcus tunisiensis TaxID=1798228 RepID=A0A1I2M3S0_9ACTN|nr:helix-turn-helix transcriptional regulator [Blastococcus sp. DSM 46838]SFF85409.1 regulatory protein, luxR family [Blastococcus sp. DSM 46838]
MLLGRERERSLIAGLLSGARVGQSAVLVLTGDAGIGKSTLLDDAAASAAGMQVLRATGTESETEVPFGALLQLLRPALVHLDRIPAPQAEALGSALALRPGTGSDRFAVGAATLSLLSRFAEDGALVVLVDDAHLLDQPSAQALVFAARRLTADPVVLLAAVRDGRPSALTDAGLPVLHVGGLSPAASGELLTSTGRRLGSSVAARLHEATGGNPLALLELVDDVPLVESLPPGAPVPVPARIARAFALRADRLSAPARTAVLVAAVGGADLAVVARACGLLGIDAAVLDEAEAAELLRVAAGVVAFRHNLVRSAVWSEAHPGLRRDVHRAVAAALPEDDVDRRAWHLAEAALGPDEDTALVLDAAAARARDRGAHAVAATASERAARLSPEPAGAVHRLVAAADSAWRAGLAGQATALLARAEELPQPPALRVSASGLRGTIAARTGSVESARDELMAAADLSAPTDPDTAILLLADAILACFILADIATVADAAARIDRLVYRAVTEPARWTAAVATGGAGVLTGHGGPERIRRAVRLLRPEGPLLRDPRLAPWLVLGVLFLRERGTGRDVVTTVVDDLRRRSDLGGLPFLLFLIARDQATDDRWDLAEVNYTEGIQLARETGSTSDLAACLAGLAWLEARLGREAACRAHAAEALEICAPRHLATFQVWSLSALGGLELALGRPQQALEHLRRLDALLAGVGLVDVDLSPAPELAEAMVHLGRTGEARAQAARHAARAAEKGQPWALARAARAVALTCEDPEFDREFARALDFHERTPDRFELARTQLAYGARLRRARRRVDARVQLRAALDTFDALGAAPWAEQAAGELRATGETAQRRGADTVGDLTPQELQIATLLAGGRTTREAAAALFLSPKTVEYHLRHVYQKLGVSSRAALSSRLTERT